MRHSLFLIFAALVPYAAHTQTCATLLRDARTLAQNQKFDDAIRKADAAKGCATPAEIDAVYQVIFTGLKQQAKDAKAAADQAIAEAENAKRAKQEAEEAAARAEAERKKAVEALETARQAKAAEQRMTYFAESNEFFRFGEAELLQKNYAKAIGFYQNALTALDAIEEKDSVVALKIELLNYRKQQVEHEIATASLFAGLIQRGDSLEKLGPARYSDAYQYLFDALATGYDSLTALQKISNLENRIEGSGLTAKKLGVRGFEYYRLFSQSAKANLILKNTSQVESRIEAILRSEASNLNALENELLLHLMTKRNSLRLSRFEFGLGGGISLAPDMKLNYGQLTFELNRYLGPKSAAGIKINAFGANNELHQNEFSAQYLLDLYRIENKTWYNAKFNLILRSGASLGFLNSSKVHYPLASIHAPEMYDQLGSPVAFRSGDFEFGYAKNIEQPGYMDLDYRRTAMSRYVNLFAGLRVKFYPDPSEHTIQIFGDLSYNYQLTPSGEFTPFEVKKTLTGEFETKYNLSASTLSDIADMLAAQGVSDGYPLRKHNKAYNAGARLEIGIFIRLISLKKVHLS